MTQVKEIVLMKSGKHAMVIDEKNEQWFCHLSKKGNQSDSDYLIDVYLCFLNNRVELFDCDVA